MLPPDRSGTIQPGPREGQSWRYGYHTMAPTPAVKAETQPATLAELYLAPAEGDPTADAVAAVSDLARHLVRSTDAERLAWSTYLPEEELLLLLFQPGSPDGVGRLLNAIGVEAVRIVGCQSIVAATEDGSSVR